MSLARELTVAWLVGDAGAEFGEIEVAWRDAERIRATAG